MTVALGGMSTQFHPMAFVRELARRRVRNLTVVSMVCGMDVDLLCAAGCIKTAVVGLCWSSFDTMDPKLLSSMCT